MVKESSLSENDTTENLIRIAQRMKERKLVGTVTIYLVFNNKFENTGLEMTYKLPMDVEDTFMQGSRKYIVVDSELEISEVKNG